MYVKYNKSHAALYHLLRSIIADGIKFAISAETTTADPEQGGYIRLLSFALDGDTEGPDGVQVVRVFDLEAATVDAMPALDRGDRNAIHIRPTDPALEMLCRALEAPDIHKFIHRDLSDIAWLSAAIRGPWSFRKALNPQALYIHPPTQEVIHHTHLGNRGRGDIDWSNFLVTESEIQIAALYAFWLMKWSDYAIPLMPPPFK
jgi:hypothetical protein